MHDYVDVTKRLDPSDIFRQFWQTNAHQGGHQT